MLAYLVGQGRLAEVVLADMEFQESLEQLKET